jgi:hypothetical protein
VGVGVRSPKILRAVRGWPCQWCYREDGTTVAAHYNGSAGGKGMGIKASDALIAGMCRRCHAEVDTSPWMTGRQRELVWRVAHDRTRRIIERMGLATDEIRQEWERFDRCD